MANMKNLKFYGKDKPPLSHEQAVEMGKKGGIASQKAKKEKKTFAEIYKSILDETNEITINGKRLKLTNKDIMARKLITEVLKGTINNGFLRGAEHIQATIGEAPVQKIEQMNYNIESKPVKMNIDELKKIRKEVFDKE